MDDLNKKIALRMQEVSVDVWADLSSMFPDGSYTSNQVYEFLEERHDGLTSVCHEEVTIEVDTFRCSVPKYMFFKILHQFEKMASIPTKNRKKFIRQANSGECADVSFVVELTKPIMSLTKSVLDKKEKLRPVLQRVALDYVNGFVVATNGRLLSARKANYQNVSAKESARNMPVLITTPAFKQCQGSTMVSATMQNGMPDKYQFLAEDGSYYEEDAVGRYPNWKAVVPKELYRSGRVTLSKDGVKQFLKFAKQADKNADVDRDGKNLIIQTEGNDLVLLYVDKGKQQTYTIELAEEPDAFTICIDPIWFKMLDGWNGTMWVSGYSRAVIFDMDETTDFHLLMPRALPEYLQLDVQDGISGTTIAFDSRHTEYRKQPKQKETEPKKEEVKPIKYLFMAAGRYEGTQPYYELEKIENGDFKVKGSHDSDLLLFLRTAAHYIRQDEAMQAEFCTYCRDQLKGKDWRSIVPLEEIALAEMFEGFLSSKGIEDIPDVEFEDAIEEPEAEPEVVEEVEEVETEEVVEESEEPKSYTFCITGTLDKSRKYYQEQIEMRGWRLASKMSTSVDILVYGESKDEAASNKIKQAIKHGTKAISAEVFYQMLDEYPIEAEEVVEEVVDEVEEVVEEVNVRPMAIEREIVPTLELETSDGTLIVAGDSYFHKLFDEENGCFRSEAAEAKFNEIDAFISDELIMPDILDYAAIAQAVGEFLEEVEQAS